MTWTSTRTSLRVCDKNSDENSEEAAEDEEDEENEENAPNPEERYIKEKEVGFRDDLGEASGIGRKRKRKGQTMGPVRSQQAYVDRSYASVFMPDFRASSNSESPNTTEDRVACGSTSFGPTNVLVRLD
ncbi:hypothetical protein K443DRAFT_8263 [Laccaria amethystina LaAM-08-1]|uniref:Uncharacterized protein n=1 Tax=Laccaria amethystina LaAM-08-1 TaxID=1095629 RepID=A0A0C9WP39_9AGAR|nr:hypothetical protein K443DRAFT_8263 [Laccaria amethystina LaAM-08-1]